MLHNQLLSKKQIFWNVRELPDGKYGRYTLQYLHKLGRDRDMVPGRFPDYFLAICHHDFSRLLKVAKNFAFGSWIETYDCFD